MALRFIGWSLAAVLLLTRVEASHADDSDKGLEQAEKYILDMELERAAELLEQLRRDGMQSSEEVERSYMMSGSVEATMGRDDEALQYFMKWAALDPRARLPEGSSPKLVILLQQAHEATTEPLNWSSRAAKGEIVVKVHANPLNMAREIRVLGDGSGLEEGRTIGNDHAFHFKLPPGKYEVQLLDENGNLLGGQSRTLRAAANVEGAPKTTPTGASFDSVAQQDESTPMVQRYQLWAVASGTFALAGVGFGVLARRSQDELDLLTANNEATSFSQAREVEETLRSRSMVANISFAASGTMAVIGTYFYFRHREKRSQSLSVTASSDSAALMTSWKF